MKKRFDVYYTVPVRETLKHYKTMFFRSDRKTNKWCGEYNTIQLGRNLKFKDALQVIARYNYADGYFTLNYNNIELCFGGRHGNNIDLTNSFDLSTSYIYKLVNPDSLYPEVEI